jgi:hypothetical protein
MSSSFSSSPYYSHPLSPPPSDADTASSSLYSTNAPTPSYTMNSSSATSDEDFHRQRHLAHLRAYGQELAGTETIGEWTNNPSAKAFAYEIACPALMSLFTSIFSPIVQLLRPPSDMTSASTLARFAAYELLQVAYDIINGNCYRDSRNLAWLISEKLDRRPVSGRTLSVPTYLAELLKTLGPAKTHGANTASPHIAIPWVRKSAIAECMPAGYTDGTISWIKGRLNDPDRGSKGITFTEVDVTNTEFSAWWTFHVKKEGHSDVAGKLMYSIYSPVPYDEVKPEYLKLGVFLAGRRLTTDIGPVVSSATEWTASRASAEDYKNWVYPYFNHVYRAFYRDTIQCAEGQYAGKYRVVFVYFDHVAVRAALDAEDLGNRLIWYDANALDLDPQLA